MCAGALSKDRCQRSAIAEKPAEVNCEIKLDKNSNHSQRQCVAFPQKVLHTNMHTIYAYKMYIIEHSLINKIVLDLHTVALFHSSIA